MLEVYQTECARERLTEPGGETQICAIDPASSIGRWMTIAPSICDVRSRSGL